MLKKLIRAAPIIAGIVGVLLVVSGVSLIEQSPAADAASLYPYILRAFAGLAMVWASLVAAQAAQDHKN